MINKYLVGFCIFLFIYYRKFKRNIISIVENHDLFDGVYRILKSLKINYLIKYRNENEISPIVNGINISLITFDYSNFISFTKLKLY